MFMIHQDGAKILETSFWDSEEARAGMLAVTSSSGVMGLLVPDAMVGVVKEMLTAMSVVISRGPYEGVDVLEFFFEDGTETPLVIYVEAARADFLPRNDESGREIGFAVWTRGGLQLSLSGHYLVAPVLPRRRGLNE